MPFGIIDLSLAPTPAIGDSVANILEEMGLESCGAAAPRPAWRCSTTPSRRAASWRPNHVGGLSGAFIPVSEDNGMIDAAEAAAA